MDEHRYNIVLILSDTFRFDLLTGFRVRNRVVRVPRLSRFASESIVFSRAYTASFPTVPHRHDLLTGRYTFTYSGWEPLPRNEITLPMILKKVGYMSMLIVDTPHILKDGFNYDRGFDGWIWIRGQENDRFRTAPKDVKLPCNPVKLRSVETTIQHLRNNVYRVREEDWIPAKTAIEAMHWLEENYMNKPFLLYVDFFDPHEPWDPPRWFIEALDHGYSGEEVIYPVYGPSNYLTLDELEHIRALYAAEALLVDKWINRLIEKIEELGLFEDTAIIFTSDHGFYLGEHRLIGKSIIVGDHQGYAPLYEEVAHIPLIIKLPDTLGVKHREVSELVQPPDITATILDLAGLDPTKFGVQGKSLLPYITSEAREPLRNIAVTSPSIIQGVVGGLRPTITSADYWSLVLASAETPKLDEIVYTMIVDGVPRILKLFGTIKTELYNLKEDPHQTKDVAKEYPDIVYGLNQEFLKFLRNLGAKEEHIKLFEKLKY